MNTIVRILIALVVAAGLIFLLKEFAFKDATTTAPEVTEQVETPANNTTQTTPKETAKPAATKSFNFMPPKPNNGVLKGVVEMGAAGFNSFIVDIDAQKNWNLDKAEWGNSLVYDNMATAGDIRNGLKEYIAKMLDYGVNGKNIHFIVSSGALKVENTQKIIKELKGLGYFVNTVTPEKEGEYALKCVLPKAFNNTAFVVDIGSGNTKISWMDGGNIKALETYGAKFYVDDVNPQKVKADVKAKSDQVPGSRTKTCFIIGGVPFKMAKEGGLENRYSVLQAPADYSLDGKKNESGILIYDAIRNSTGCDNFVFDKEANFAIGFLLGV